MPLAKLSKDDREFVAAMGNDDGRGANPSNAKIVSYRLVESRDISVAMDRRKLCKILVAPGTGGEELERAMKAVVADETARDPEIDEISVFAFGKPEEVSGPYTLGML